MSRVYSNVKAFTLIELLVVIAIIAILIGLVSIQLNKSRVYAKQTQCSTHFRQLLDITTAYTIDYRDKLPWAMDIASASPYRDQSPSPYKEYEKILKCPLGLRRYDGRNEIGNIEYFYYFGWKITNGSTLLFPSEELYWKYNKSYFNSNNSNPTVLFMERDRPHNKKGWVLYWGSGDILLKTVEEERLPFE